MSNDKKLTAIEEELLDLLVRADDVRDVWPNVQDVLTSVYDAGWDKGWDDAQDYFDLPRPV